jgi:hypothetical protein
MRRRLLLLRQFEGALTLRIAAASNARDEGCPSYVAKLQHEVTPPVLSLQRHNRKRYIGQGQVVGRWPAIRRCYEQARSRHGRGTCGRQET